ncbi:hypothetical protein FGO68_gene9185 [Halteria grandinella]|uniref:Uncharacterized protein n=1 Tax=Halteria grandinella TaxID=5974 RepID=A0A8J8P2L2_HALGN|nr:hypothetical protein FGO68_gene9185 [Halteria grandinella]
MGVIGNIPGGISLPPIQSSSSNHQYNTGSKNTGHRMMNERRSSSTSSFIKEASVKKMFSLMPLGDIDKYDSSSTNVLTQQKTVMKAKPTGIATHQTTNNTATNATEVMSNFSNTRTGGKSGFRRDSSEQQAALKLGGGRGSKKNSKSPSHTEDTDDYYQ